jgi:hypothetical protein
MVVKMTAVDDSVSIELTPEERNAFVESMAQEPHEFIRAKIAELRD